MMIPRAADAPTNFYPRPPRGGRPSYIPPLVCVVRFLSTPSARRATVVQPLTHDLLVNFYPRPPRGGRLSQLPATKPAFVFLSTPSARRATYHAEITNRIVEFLSTPSARRATIAHSLQYRLVLNFYPRPPRGGRQQKQRQNLYFLINYTTFCTNLEEP